MRVLKLLPVFIIFSGSVVLGETLYVPSDYATIQTAVVVASDGDVIEVADGVYTGPGNRDIDFTRRRITLRSASGDPEACILDCQGQGRAFYFDDDSADGSVIEGLTVMNGRVEDTGGAARIEYSAPIFRNCVFRTNTSLHSGGGFYIYRAVGNMPEFENCVFANNSCDEGAGGGLCLSSSGAIFTNCTFESNECESYGGGVRIGGGYGSTFTGCTFSRNSANVGLAYGGGLYVDSEMPVSLTDCVFVGNSSLSNGGGLYASFDTSINLTQCVFVGNHGTRGAGLYRETGSTLITNCTFYGNQGRWGGAGVYGYRTSGLSIVNSILWNNDVTRIVSGTFGEDLGYEVNNSDDPIAFNCCIQKPEQQALVGDGCVSVYPMFLEPYGEDGEAGTADDDLRLLPSSPCVDTGSNDYVDESIQEDPNGNPRILDGDGDSVAIVDMGAYESDRTCPAIELSQNAFEFFVMEGGESPEPFVFTLENAGEGHIFWQITGLPDWITVSPSQGESDGEKVYVTVTVDTSDLPRGVVTESFTVSAPEAINSPMVQLTFHVAGILSVPEDYDSISAALEAAVIPHDIVELADGTYTGNGNTNLIFEGKVVTIRSASGNPCQCIIDSEGQGRAFSFIDDEGADSVIDGLLITGGLVGPDYPDYSGYDGGGVFCSGGACPTIRNCVFKANAARWGGGVYAGGDCHIINCVFLGNFAEQGAGVFIYDHDVTISNCSFSLNTASNIGGGVYAYRNGHSVLVNSIFWMDSPQEIACSTSNANYWPDVSWCLVQGGSSDPWFGEGCIDADPLFESMVDLRLTSASPCVDRGTNTPPGGLLSGDILGEPRLQDGNADGELNVDMGAYERVQGEPVMVLNQTEFIFFVESGTAAGDDQVLAFYQIGGEAGTWSITGQVDWLTVTPSEGSSSFEETVVSLAVDASGLTPGTYNCGLTFNATAVANPQVSISVALQVTNTLRVPEDYATIQAAIDAAEAGDLIQIADGVYSGMGNSNLDCLGKAITIESRSGNPLSCVIDCQQSGRGISFQNAEEEDTVLRGVTIQNGVVDGHSNYGGGILCSDASPTIGNCVLRSNYGAAGGGMYCNSNASPQIKDCLFIDNESPVGGGGLAFSQAIPSLSGCVFIGNHAQNGGGVQGGGDVSETQVSFVNCKWIANTAESGAGTNCGGHYVNCLFLDNVATRYAGGVSSNLRSKEITNCTFRGNSAGIAGGACYVINGDVITNCILWDNGPDEIYGYNSPSITVTYSAIQDGSGNYWFGGTNIDSDPLFASPDDATLLSDSPCVDGGTNTANDSPVDIGGNLRMLDGNGDGVAVIDMGAYEYSENPKLVLSEEYLSLETYEGVAVSGELSIRNAGIGTIPWTISGQPSWLSILPSSGVTGADPDVVTFRVDDSLPHGIHAVELELSSPGTTSTFRIEIAVAGSLEVPSEYPTIHAAVLSAIDRDEIVLADGTYTGPENKNIYLIGMHLSIRSASGDPSSCIIDCEHSGRVIRLRDARHFQLVGLTVRNCIDSAIWCGSSDLFVSNCVFTGNDGPQGGALYIVSSSPGIRIENSLFQDNTAEKGGGIYNRNANAIEIDHCQFVGNSVETYGGGICTEYDCLPTITDCVFVGNDAENGGGLYNGTDCHSKLSHCLFIGNTASNGAGISVTHGDSSLEMSNCTLFSNVASRDGGGIDASSFSDLIINNSILWGNKPVGIDAYGSVTSAITYSCIQDRSVTFGTGCIHYNPQFLDPAGADGIKGTDDDDLHLHTVSPCVDTGDPESDFSHEPEPNGGRINMGYYGNSDEATSGIGVYIVEFTPRDVTRTGRTIFDYEMGVLAGNPGTDDLTDVSLELIDTPEGIEIVDGAVEIDVLHSNEELNIPDSFTVSIDRLYPVNQVLLVWQLTYSRQGVSHTVPFEMPIRFAVPGDMDSDLDVDLDDFAAFSECLTGPVVPAGADCSASDLNSDGHVDLADYAEFQQYFGFGE